jgi:hypothetical protein
MLADEVQGRASGNTMRCPKWGGAIAILQSQEVRFAMRYTCRPGCRIDIIASGKGRTCLIHLANALPGSQVIEKSNETKSMCNFWWHLNKVRPGL